MNLLIDNYDSFTYNIAQALGELGHTFEVVRNDAIDVDRVRTLGPESIIISPGPGRPENAGISTELVREFHDKLPILGICLGHQCIVEAFGGTIDRADRIMHGKVSPIRHFGHKLFEGIESPFIATRYHSLIVKRDTCPDELEIIAETDEKEIMGFAHREHPVVGVQFHPESILTDCGKRLLSNFLAD